MIDLARLAGFVALLLAPTGIAAHDSRPLFVAISETGPSVVQLSWKAPPSIAQSQAPSITLARPCKFQGKATTTKALQGLAFYDCPTGISGVALSIDYPLYNPSLSTLIRVTFESGEERSAILEPATSKWRIPAAASFASVTRSYFEIGVKHILGGFDHLLFLAGLLFIARTPRRVLVTVTGFTIAHSLTIFLVTLNIIQISVPAVEALIALSIVFLAAEIARDNRQSLTWRRPIFVASGFGLAHGAGFAAALTETGLPQTETISALVFFNIGVEAGQIAFILAVFAAAWAAKRARAIAWAEAAPARLAFSYGLGVIAAAWFFKRLAGAVL